MSKCGRFACVQVAEIGASAFRNVDIPNIDGSDCLSVNFGSLGYPNCRYSALRISDLGSQGMSLSCLYIKASECQCSSDYYWCSL